jgi:hypothetical protein
MCLPINWPITRTQHAGIGSECNHHSGDLESWGLQQKGVQAVIRPHFVILPFGDRESCHTKGCGMMLKVSEHISYVLTGNRDVHCLQNDMPITQLCDTRSANSVDFLMLLSFSAMSKSERD